MAARYDIEFVPAARRELAAVPLAARHRLASLVDSLAVEPRPSGVKHVRGLGGGLRVRSGDYRILYQVFDRKLLVLVIRIRHPSEVYREAALRRARRGAT